MRAPPETRCKICLQIFCCAEHRIAHEIRKHSFRGKSFFNQHPSVRITANDHSANRILSVEPNAPRKRKRESLIQESKADGSKDKTESSGGSHSSSFSIISSVTHLFRNVFTQSARQEKWNITSEEVTEEALNITESGGRRRLVPMRMAPPETPRRHRWNAVEEESHVFFAPRPRPPLHPQPRRILLSPARSEPPSPLRNLSLSSIENSIGRFHSSPMAYS